MPHELCLVEATATPQLSVSRMLRAEDGYCCSHREWSSFSVADLNRFHSQLLLAVAVPETKEAVDFFHALLRQSPRVPTLAVVPTESSEELLRTTSEVADDFMFWPVHERELQQRVKRLLGMPRPDLEAAKRALTAELGLAQGIRWA